MTKAKEIIQFMKIAEGLKRELRHSWLSDGRRESVAEHTWSTSLLALLLFDQVKAKVDRSKVLKMIIIHDLVEIYAGDMPSFDAANGKQKEKEVLEHKALIKLLKDLPDKKLSDEIKSMYEELHANRTNEAKFVQACDKADAVIQHNKANIDSFSQGDYDINPYYKDYLFDFDEFIRTFKDQINIDSMVKIEKEGDISRVSKEQLDKWEKIKMVE